MVLTKTWGETNSQSKCDRCGFSTEPGLPTEELVRRHVKETGHDVKIWKEVIRIIGLAPTSRSGV